MIVGSVLPEHGGIGGVFEVAEMERNMLISVTEAGKDKKVALMIMCDVV